MQIDRQFYGGVRNYAASVLISCKLHVAGSDIEHTYKVSPSAISIQPVHQCQMCAVVIEVQDVPNCVLWLLRYRMFPIVDCGY